MREKLNSDPRAQAALVGVLLLAAVFLFISRGGGGEEEGVEAGTTQATVGVAGTNATGSATAATPGEAVEAAAEEALSTAVGEATASTAVVPPAAAVAAPPLPRDVEADYKAGKTVVLLIVHDGGIDDRIVERSAPAIRSLPNVALYVVPASQISRYAAITLGTEVDKVPALVVVRPKQLSEGVPQATVLYGFQSLQSLTQEVRDASYSGPTVGYDPN